MRLHRILAGSAVAGLALGSAWYVREVAPASALLRADPNAVPQNADLMRFAVGRGETAFRAACAGCHGAEAAGDPHYGAPNLADADWLYGTGTPAEIERTITYGIRSHHPKAWNLAAMPAYARPVPLQGQNFPPLTPPEIADVVAYVASLSGGQADPTAIADGADLFTGKAGCFDCHAADARGDAGVGAPDLTDKAWLYGDSSRAAIMETVAYGRQGVCPAQVGSLTPTEIREAALYVYALGKGK